MMLSMCYGSMLRWTSTHPANFFLPQLPIRLRTLRSMLRIAQHGLPALDVCVIGDADSAILSFISQHAAATKLSTE